MAKIIPIFRVYDNTRRIIFQLASKDDPNGIDITNWTGFTLNIDPVEYPTAPANVANLIGTILVALSGRVYFVPTGTVPVGNYFYNARGIDENGESITFAKGPFNITQKI